MTLYDTITPQMLLSSFTWLKTCRPCNAMSLYKAMFYINILDISLLVLWNEYIEFLWHTGICSLHSLRHQPCLHISMGHCDLFRLGDMPLSEPMLAYYQLYEKKSNKMEIIKKSVGSFNMSSGRYGSSCFGFFLCLGCIISSHIIDHVGKIGLIFQNNFY